MPTRKVSTTTGTITGRFPKGPALQRLPPRIETTRQALNACIGTTPYCEALDEQEAKINGALPKDDLDELMDDSCGLSLPLD